MITITGALSALSGACVGSRAGLPAVSTVDASPLGRHPRRHPEMEWS